MGLGAHLKLATQLVVCRELHHEGSGGPLGWRAGCEPIGASRNQGRTWSSAVRHPMEQIARPLALL